MLSRLNRFESDDPFPFSNVRIELSISVFLVSEWRTRVRRKMGFLEEQLKGRYPSRLMVRCIRHLLVADVMTL